MYLDCGWLSGKKCLCRFSDNFLFFNICDFWLSGIWGRRRKAVNSVGFPSGPPAQYWPGLASLSYGVRMGSGVFDAVWSTADEISVCDDDVSVFPAYPIVMWIIPDSQCMYTIGYMRYIVAFLLFGAIDWLRGRHFLYLCRAPLLSGWLHQVLYKRQSSCLSLVDFSSALEY